MTVISARWRIAYDMARRAWLADSTGRPEVDSDDLLTAEDEALLDADEAAGNAHIQQVLEEIVGESVWLVPAHEVESDIRAAHGRRMSDGEEAEATEALDDWQAQVAWPSQGRRYSGC